MRRRINHGGRPPQWRLGVAFGNIHGGEVRRTLSVVDARGRPRSAPGVHNELLRETEKKHRTRSSVCVATRAILENWTLNDTEGTEWPWRGS